MCVVTTGFAFATNTSTLTVAEIAAWAVTLGSLSWCTGLGRLLQRSGEAWAAAGESRWDSPALPLA